MQLTESNLGVCVGGGGGGGGVTLLTYLPILATAHQNVILILDIL